MIKFAFGFITGALAITVASFAIVYGRPESELHETIHDIKHMK